LEIETRMAYSQIPDSENIYMDYYNTFKQYSTTELLDLCEQNKLSIYGEKLILIDRLSVYFSQKNKPSKLTLCMKSIKQIFFNVS
jgi:hypothetical protein